MFGKEKQRENSLKHWRYFFEARRLQTNSCLVEFPLSDTILNPLNFVVAIRRRSNIKCKGHDLPLGHALYFLLDTWKILEVIMIVLLISSKWEYAGHILSVIVVSYTFISAHFFLISVCVSHLKRCKASTLPFPWLMGQFLFFVQIFRRCRGHYAWWWKPGLIAGVPALLSYPFSRHGRGPSAEPKTVVFKEPNLPYKNGLSRTLALAMVASLMVFESFRRPIPVKSGGVFLHVGSEFAMIILTKSGHEASV